MRNCRVPLAFIACMGSLHAAAEHYPNTPMPDRPGCEILRCVPIFDGVRKGKRCYWRCPRRKRAPDFHFQEPPRRDPAPPPADEAPAPNPPPQPRSYSPPKPPPEPPPRRYETPPEPGLAPGIADAQTVDLWLLILAALAAAAAIGLLQHLWSLAAARDDAIDRAADITAARDRLDAAAREADALIERYRADLRRQGRMDAS
jgi:hypothetical protein